MTKRRFRQEEGASLVEVGLVLPLLLMLAIGLAEVGFLVIDFITVSNAARSGARTGSSAANDPAADDLILNVVEEAACNLRFGDLDTVIIFLPNADGSIPEVGGVPDFSRVNTYEPGSGGLACGSPAHGLVLVSGSWSPSSRNRVPPNFDTVGVQVTFRHEGVTRLLPFPTVTWTDSAIMQVEPDLRG